MSRRICFKPVAPIFSEMGIAVATLDDLFPLLEDKLRFQYLLQSYRLYRLVEFLREGKTYRQIGSEMGISAERVRQLLHRMVDKLQRDGLSGRAVHCIARAGLGNKEELKEAIRKQEFHPERITNLGWGTMEEICDWLAVELPARVLKRTCPHCGGEL